METSYHIIEPRSGIICLALLFAVTLPAADNKSIPWKQIGAKAGADYKGDGLTVTPTASGARLHCVFQRLDGDATPEGLWLSSTVTGSTTDRFRVTAMAVGRPENFGVRQQSGLSAEALAKAEAASPLSETVPATGDITISNQIVRFIRPNLTEEYSVSMDGLRQDFIIGQTLVSATGDNSPSPGGEGRGEGEPNLKTLTHSSLVLTLSVTGARVESSPDGATLILEHSGRRIAYTRLRVTDATGKQLPAHIEVSPVGDEVTSLKSSDLFGDNFGEPNPLISDSADPKLAIIINDTDAIYPLRIDPTFSDANWVSMGYYPGVAGNVSTEVTDNSGNLYVGGNFDNMYYEPPDVGNYIAKWNGSNWSTLGSGLNSTVSALAVSGSTLYAGGYFTTAGGSNADYIAQWNGTNWSPLGSGMNSSVQALVVSGGMLYAGGTFTNAGGNSANYVAQWNGSSWSALGSGVGGGSYPSVNALVMSGSTLYAGGSFATAGGVAASCVAQWDGTAWSALGAGITDPNGLEVTSLAVSGSTLYAGGIFTNAGGVPANYITQWNGSTWSALGSGLGGEEYAEVLALAVADGTLYAGGYFTTADGSNANNIAQWNGTNWLPLGSGIPGGGTVLIGALAISGETLYAGGNFGSTTVPVDNLAFNNIAQWNSTNWLPLGSGILYARTNGDDTTQDEVNAWAVLHGTVYAAGAFNQAGGTSINNIAQWSSGIWLPVGVGVNSQINALATLGNLLYAGGTFTNAGGNPANYVAQWDGTNWTPLGAGMNGQVFALAVSSNTLYAGGSFTNAGGSNANDVAQWNGTNWIPLGSGMNGTVFALAVSGSNLYVGGEFTTAGGIAASNIAQWNGTNWVPLGSGVGPIVRALAVSGNLLYAGGALGSAGGNVINGIAQWNGINWSPAGSGISGLQSVVYALAVSGSNLYAGGEFTTAGGVAASAIAQWDGVNWSALGSGVVDYEGYPSEVNAISVLGNKLYVGGTFSVAGVTLSSDAAIFILPISLFILPTDGNFGFTNGYFGFDISGPPSSNVVIQSSTDLQNWIPLQTNQFNSNGLLYFSDSQSPLGTQRFYQAVLP